MHPSGMTQTAEKTEGVSAQAFLLPSSTLDNGKSTNLQDDQTSPKMVAQKSIYLQRAVQLKTDQKDVLVGPNYYSLLSHQEKVLQRS